ncbi:anthranilate synthase family protein [Catenuloplanes atrovinosus]|uniref:anthranilate synthase n=1 Tax=Catenuloplanes atrovinosus TaxID=137266 RepID=A0AAE3YKR8_9ACTN|nr:chorismate-binding protein [Catenuloplanes atrovinosus]MDR7273621.1 phenazine biosynthesis protein phzE [Catenuloplanes atrovinosus]
MDNAWGAPFALLCRGGAVEFLTGQRLDVAEINDLPADRDILTVLPYRQLSERGFACHDDGMPLLAFAVESRDAVPVDTFLSGAPDRPVTLTGGHFDVADDDYAAIVRAVVRDEIGTGQGSNFVVKRSFRARVDGFSREAAIALFARLLGRETGAYWTFLVHLDGRTLIGASPERHVSLHGGVATMNPISGTYRYPPGGAERDGLLAFLRDAKETDELSMVVDEELKMMAAVCERGGHVIGPELREMAHLAHTEYLVAGTTTLDARDVLRLTMFAPTVTGSPLENACRAIRRHEPVGRGYYGGVLALLTRDGKRSEMDSAILIRTAEITGDELSIGVGATLVRGSDPDSEAAETRAKAAALLDALTAPPRRRTGTRRRFAGDPEVRAALAARNEALAPYWLDPRRPGTTGTGSLASDQRIAVVDGEDTFTEMLATQVRSLGPKVEVIRYDEPFNPDAFDLTVIGPGPGDPGDTDDPKISTLRRLTHGLLNAGRPFLAVCLGHQVLSTVLGLPLVRKDVPYQGTQLRIDLFGEPARVGFYNTFTAREAREVIHSPLTPDPVRVCRDPVTHDVYALRGRRFRSFQFHPESVLSPDGLPAVRAALSRLLLSRTR